MQGWGKGEGEKSEAVCHTTSTLGATGGGLRGSSGGLLCVCIWWRGSRKEDVRNERVIPKLPEQFVTLEWLLSYPGGPLSRKVLRLSSGGKGGA